MSHKIRKRRKNATSTKHRKTRDFLAGKGVGGWGGGPRRGENRRTAMPRPGGPWPDLRADAPRRLRRISRPSISSQCGLESFWMGTCFRNIFLMFFEKSSWQGIFPKNCCQFQLVTSCKGASVQRLLCVKAFVCKSFCVKTTVCKDFFV